MNKRDALIIIIIILIISAAVTYYYYTRGGEYEANIERHYSTEEERQAIIAAEDLNYTRYVQFPKFNEDWSTNFINGDIISHYKNITDDAASERRELDIYYDYVATAKYYEDFNVTIENNYSLLNISINGNDIMSIFHKGYGVFYSDELVILKILKGIDKVPPEDADFLEIKRFDGRYEHNQNLSEMYLIEMYLSYREVYSATSESTTEIFQIVMLDSDYKAKLIILFPPHESDQ